MHKQHKAASAFVFCRERFYPAYFRALFFARPRETGNTKLDYSFRFGRVKCNQFTGSMSSRSCIKRQLSLNFPLSTSIAEIGAELKKEIFTASIFDCLD